MTRKRIPKKVWFHLHVTTLDGAVLDFEAARKPHTTDEWQAFFDTITAMLNGAGAVPVCDCPVVPKVARGERVRLPDRRDGGYRQKFTMGGSAVYLNTGEYADGSLAEVWLDAAKEGQALRTWMEAFATVVSVALQYGTPAEILIRQFLGVHFEPCGPVQGHDVVKSASSFLDAVAQDLALNYLDGQRDANEGRL